MTQLSIRTEQPAAWGERSATTSSKILVVLSMASYLFWLGHSYAIREALAAVHYLMTYSSRH